MRLALKISAALILFVLIFASWVGIIAVKEFPKLFSKESIFHTQTPQSLVINEGSSVKTEFGTIKSVDSEDSKIVITYETEKGLVKAPLDPKTVITGSSHAITVKEVKPGDKAAVRYVFKQGKKVATIVVDFSR